MNKYKLTYENGKTEIVFSKTTEEKMKSYYLPKDGSYVISGGRMVVNVELLG